MGVHACVGATAGRLGHIGTQTQTDERLAQLSTGVEVNNATKIGRLHALGYDVAGYSGADIGGVLKVFLNCLVDYEGDK